MANKRLKNLEGAILGTIKSSEPCTAYAVHKYFSLSPSLYFSGSAGAVYPAFRRLEARGLIKATSVGTSKRPAKGYVLTREGVKSFQTWYHDPDLIADAGFDPLRLRISLIQSQNPKTRNDVLDGMITATQNKIRRAKKVRKDLPEKSAIYFSSHLELIAHQAKLKQLKIWKKEGAALDKIDIGFNALVGKKLS